MKQNNGDTSVYSFELDDNVSMSKYNESLNHSFLKVKTMKNNCVNLKCLDNIQKLCLIKEKYKELENKYFELENSGSRKCEEFEDLLHKKESELNNLKKLKSTYIDHKLNHLDYYQLKSLESKILLSLSLIKNEKDKIYLKKTKGSMLGKKSCIICYENEMNILFKPCNHLCVCNNCSSKVDSCPMCRTKIKEKNKIKYS